MAWSFPAVDATSSPRPRRLDGNLTHCLISTQTPTKSKPNDSWTRVRCRLAHDEGATGATRDEAGAAASATSKAALLAIFAVPGAGSLSQRYPRQLLGSRRCLPAEKLDD